MVVIDYDFFIIVVIERHSQELPPSSQQSDLPNATTELVGAVGGEHDVPHSQNTKKRKPNASGKKTTSVVWDHFTRSLESTDSIEHVIIVVSDLDVIQRYMEHLTFLITLKGCVLNIHLLPLMTPTKTLTFKSGDNKNILATPQKYNVEACQKAIAMFVIMDEQPFKVVEGVGFKILCRQL